MEEAADKIGAGFFCFNLPLVLHAAPLLILLTMIAAPDADSASRCYCNELGKNAQVWRLNLYAKDPATWQVIEGGARGELLIQRPSGRFELNVYGVRPNTEYALVHYEGKPPFGQVLVRGLSDVRGNFNIMGTWQRWTRKFWVVPSTDLRGRSENFKPGMNDELKTWRPTEYLFESEELPDENDLRVF